MVVHLGRHPLVHWHANSCFAASQYSLRVQASLSCRLLSPGVSSESAGISLRAAVRLEAQLVHQLSPGQFPRYCIALGSCPATGIGELRAFCQLVSQN